MTTEEKPKKSRNPVPLVDRIMPLDKLVPLVAVASVKDRAELAERARKVIDVVRESLKESDEAKALRESLS